MPTSPVPRYNAGDLSVNGMAETAGCLPISLCFLKAELILAEHMATQQTDYFPASLAQRSCDCLLDNDG